MFFGILEKVYFKEGLEYLLIELWQVNLDVWIEYRREFVLNLFVYYDILNNFIIVNFFIRLIQFMVGVKGYMNLVELLENKEIRFDFVIENLKF